MNKIIVWDLFGGGQNSVFNALKEYKNFEIYTFDITEPTHSKQFKVNLAQKNIIDYLKQFPKPDIIVASPLCQSFSSILSMKNGGTCFWKLNVKKNKLIFRSVAEFNSLKSGFTKHFDAKTQKYLAQLGKRCIDNTIQIIKFFNPKFWYIENPKHSLMWKYIILNRQDFFNPEMQFFNEANYGKYGFLTRKPTYFLSNLKMNLKMGKNPKIYFNNIDGYLNLIDNPNIKLKVNSKSRSGILIDLEKVKSNSNSEIITIKNKTQKNKLTDYQFSESNLNSSIPKKLIIDIFKHFAPEIFKKKNQNLNVFIQQQLFRSI